MAAFSDSDGFLTERPHGIGDYKGTEIDRVGENESEIVERVK